MLGTGCLELHKHKVLNICCVCNLINQHYIQIIKLLKLLIILRVFIWRKSSNFATQYIKVHTELQCTIYVCAKTLSTTFDIFNWHQFMYSAFSSLRKQSGATYLAFLYWLCNMFMVAIKISGRHLLTYKWKYKNTTMRASIKTWKHTHSNDVYFNYICIFQ